MNQIVRVPRHQLKRRLLTYKRRQSLRQRDIAGLVDLIDLFFRFPLYASRQLHLRRRTLSGTVTVLAVKYSALNLHVSVANPG